MPQVSAAKEDYNFEDALSASVQAETAIDIRIASMANPVQKIQKPPIINETGGFLRPLKNSYSPLGFGAQRL